MKIRIKLSYVILALFAGVGTPGICQEDTETRSSKSVPKIEIEVEDQHIGMLEEGDVRDFVIPIRNSGGKELIIQKVKGGCGCTKVRAVKKTLAPGESTNILGEFDSKGRPGMNQTKSITLTSNDPNNPITRLGFTVDVVQTFMYTPKAIHFGNIRNDSSTTRSLNIVARSDRVMQVTSKETGKSTDIIEVQIANHSVDEPNSGDNQTTYTVTIVDMVVRVREGADPGAFRDQLVVKTNLPEQEEFKVTLIARIQGDLIVKPYQFFLGRVNAGASVSKKCTISSEKSHAFKIMDVLCDDFPVTWDIVDDQSAKKILKVNFGIPEDAVKSRRSKVMIVTDHPEQEKLIIPVSASIVNRSARPAKKTVGSSDEKP